METLLIAETLDITDTFTQLIAQKSSCPKTVTDCNMTGNVNVLLCSLLESLFINILTPGSLVSALGSV